MKTILISTALAAAAFAQPFGPGHPGSSQQLNVDDVKAYLNLTDSQIQSLRQIQTQAMQASQNLFQEIATKQKALRDLMDKGSTDAAALGRLMLDTQALRKRIQDSHAAVTGQARNVLTDAQKAKLKPLEDAAALREEIHQAAMLRLLAPPAEGVGGGFGPGMGPGMGMGAGMGAGMGPRGGQPGFGPRFAPRE